MAEFNADHINYQTSCTWCYCTTVPV